MSGHYGTAQHPGYTSPELMRAPTLPTMFPCANRVKMPQIGANETSLKPQVVISLEKPVLIPPRLPAEVSDAYVKTISCDLNFSEDVVKHRSYHTLPYDKKYFREVLDISDIVKSPEKTKFTMARHNARGTDKRHAPCHIKKQSTHKLKPIKRKILEKARDMKKAEDEYRATHAAPTLVTTSTGATGATADPFFFTEVETTAPTEAVTEHQLATRHQWDEYLLSIVSDGTAHWIANHQTEPTYNQDRLKTFLKDRCGSLDQRAELIKDTASEPDLDLEREKTMMLTKKKWKRPDENLLDRIRKIMTSDDEKPRDPYDDNTDAAFYRLPAGFRRAKKQIDKEEDAACNSTAFNIEVKRYVPPPLPTIRDSFNPKLRTKLYDTDNEFQKDWLTGGKHVYERSSELDRIITDTGNKYKKEFVKESPAKPEVWFPLSAREQKKREKDEKKVKVVPKGMHRWRDLPEPVDGFDRTMNAPGTDTLMDTMNDSSAPKMMRTKNTLTMMVNDWRSRWHLDMRYADATPDDLIRDMADLHTHIKLKAITTCARAAEYKPPPEPGIQLSNEPEVDYVRLLPENLFVALECCLDDKHEQVRLAAAIALYTLERPVQKAEVILRQILHQEGGSDDKWTAAQCLAYYGECDSSVVGELIKQLLEADDLMRHEQAATLLSTLSEGSTLVHCMVGEQLNSSSWRHRVMAIKTIPKLQGHINKDLVHKLTHLMWFDWHQEVRKAAAQALGKTGHGKDVHDDLIDKIKNGSEKTRVEAVSKVGHLGIMTAKLVPIFLACFHDSYVSVRMEACIACTNLRIKDPVVLEKLVFCATFDPIWKIKALAIQAMGVIGETPANVRECILWAFRFEEQEGVRAEACHSIRMLQMEDEEVKQILQDRYLVESSDVVRDELLKALEMFGISPTEDMNMVAQVKGEVRKLCTKMNISAQICVNEKEDRDRENVKRMIVQPPAEPKKEPEEPKPHRPFSQASTHASTGYVHSSRLPIVDMRPYSRESSVVDKEIQDIFEKAKRGSLTPETMSRPTTASKSRPDTAQSSKSRKTEPISELDEEGLEDDVGEEGVQESGRTEDSDLPTATSGNKKSAPQQNVDSEDAKEEDATPKQNRPSPIFTDDQTYVELTGKDDVEGESSRDVVKLDHDKEKVGGQEDKVELSTIATSEVTSDADSFSLHGSNLHLNQTQDGSVQQEPSEPSLPPTQRPMTQDSSKGGERESMTSAATTATQEAVTSQEVGDKRESSDNKTTPRPVTRQMSDLGSIKE